MVNFARCRKAWRLNVTDIGRAFSTTMAQEK